MTTTPNDDRNEVYLRGRLAALAEYREMPSGDQLATFRLIVSRPAGERTKVDTLDCVSDKPRVRRSLERIPAGAAIEVAGSLRRRFWRTPTGPASRYAVDVSTVKVLRPGRRGGASADPMPV